MQAQKTATVSNVDLYQQMHGLTLEIRKHFADYVDKVARIEKAFEGENHSLENQRTRARTENNKAENDNRKTFVDANNKAKSFHAEAMRRAQSEFDQAQASVSSLRSSLTTMKSWAEDHLRRQRVAPETIQLGIQKSSRKTPKPLESAQRAYQEGEKALSGFNKIRRPERLVWPNSNAAGIGLMVLALAVGLLFSYLLDWNFSVGLFIFGAVYIGSIIMLHVSISKRLRIAFNEWLLIERAIDANLDQYQAEKQSSFNQEKQKLSQQLEARKQEAQQTLERELAVRRDELSAVESRFHRMFSDASVRHQQNLDATRLWLAGETESLNERCANMAMATGFAGADWNSPSWDNWKAPVYPAAITRFGSLNLSIDTKQHIFPNIKLDFSLPAITPFASGRCLLYETSSEAKEAAVAAAQSTVLRLLATIPPGKVRLTLIDPVGLGQNVAAFMPLADFDESLIQSRAWTEPQHIEEQLAKLTEHMETVIQKYLRSDFPTIEDYNKQAGEVAEPYRVLLVLDFPVNFSEAAARRLVSIARNGPRCGVFTIVLRDTAKKLPYQFNVADLEQSSTVVKHRDGGFVWSERELDKCSLQLDKLPPAAISNQIIKETGEQAIDAMKVQVPYSKLLELAGLTGNLRWQGNTAAKIQVPLGPTGARKLQLLTLGEGTGHHAIIIGRTGSGKSNLMHVIITTLALKYSPEEMRLYLIDFKQGVEFKPYAEAALPHAEVIAIESEREFGLSVLNGLNDKLLERGEKFRKAGVNNITEYRQKTGEKVPRILLLVDEFQEFFTQEDNIARQANMIMDRLVRQGRYAGIHLMIGSQNLAASRSIPTPTINQMGIRIALQSSDADARQVLADDNPAARLLSRPGEAIYNSASGLIEGNNFFQVALFTDADRQEQLQQISKAYKKTSGPRIFEGNEPASLQHCEPLTKLLSDREWPAETRSPIAWLGEPIAIKQPTAVTFRRQSGSHLLVITRDEEEGIGVLTAAVLGLAAQQSPDRAHFFNLDLTTVDTPWENMAEDTARLLPHNVEVFGRRSIPTLLQDLANEVNRRTQSDLANEPAIFLIIQGIQRARDLRQESGGGLGFGGSGEAPVTTAPALLARLLKDGPEVGIHLLVWCDAYSNLKQVVEPRLLGEFGLRVAGAMSNEDSMRLLDDPSASRLDRPHRAVYFDEERPGYLEKFRPYALPDATWFARVAQRLQARTARSQTA